MVLPEMSVKKTVVMVTALIVDVLSVELASLFGSLKQHTKSHCAFI